MTLKQCVVWLCVHAAALALGFYATVLCLDGWVKGRDIGFNISFFFINLICCFFNWKWLREKYAMLDAFEEPR